MDRGAWKATVHGVTRVRQDLVTKQKQQILNEGNSIFLVKIRKHYEACEAKAVLTFFDTGSWI